MASAGVQRFGVRHHGPGSARSLVHALEAHAPQLVLIEGPPDANELLPLAKHAGLEPPVALLVYATDEANSERADKAPEIDPIGGILHPHDKVGDAKPQ